MVDFIGTDSSDTFNGGDSADTAQGAGGDDTLNGNGGNDILDGGSGYDHLFGGDGNDMLYGAGDYDSIDGGAGDDQIWGDYSPIGSDNELGPVGPHNNFDYLYGGDGADIIHGDWGNDNIYSGRGNAASGQGFYDLGLEHDQLFGDDGNDSITAGYGDDVDGGAGNNDLSLSLGIGDAGVIVDTAATSGSAGVMVGGGLIRNIQTIIYIGGTRFADTITIDQQISTTIYGGEGADIITTGRCTALINPGPGIDIVKGGSGAIGIILGLPSDIEAGDQILAGSGGGSIYAFGYPPDDQPGPVFDLTGVTFSNIQTIGARSPNSIFRMNLDQFAGVTWLNATIQIADAGTLALAGVNINGGYFHLSAAGNTLDMTGVTTVIGGDTVHGASGDIGNDTIIGSVISDNLSGGGGDDVLRGNAGIDHLSGDDGNDLLFGGDDNDSLAGGSGDDILDGGMGADVLDGGSGVDTVSYQGSQAGEYVNLMTNSGDGGFAAGDTFLSIENVIGSAFADTIVGDTGANRLDGGAGADHLYGGLGDDIFIVDRVDDIVFENANEGTDTVISSAGYYLYANIENLTLAAGAGDIFGVGNELSNTLRGNEGSNLLIAGAGDDVLYGGAGVDALFGQDGSDYLLGEAGIDYLVGGDGSDMLNGGDDADALYGEDGNDTLYGGYDFQTDILVGGNGDDVLRGDSGLGDYDLMDGGAGDDVYVVDTPADVTFEAVNGGIDTVYAYISGTGYYLYANVENLVLWGETPYGVGNELDNQLTGSASANYLLGGAGNDVLNGKAGNDVLFGESGADIFVFEHGTGGDVIGDFLAGTDKIDLSAFGFASFAQVQAAMVENGGTTAINLGGGDFIVINGVGNAALHADDFVLGGGTAGTIPAPFVTQAHLPSYSGQSNHFASMLATIHAGDAFA